FNGYFAGHFPNALHDWDPVDEPIKYGNAVFVRKSFKVKYSTGFIHREYGAMREPPDFVPAARNMQVVRFENEGAAYVVAHFHGLWNGNGKGDCPERAAQSKRVNRLLMDARELC